MSEIRAVPKAHRERQALCRSPSCECNSKRDLRARDCDKTRCLGPENSRSPASTPFPYRLALHGRVALLQSCVLAVRFERPPTTTVGASPQRVSDLKGMM